MSRILISLKKWLLISLVASIGMYFLACLVMEADEATPAIRSFVASNERIQSEVGIVQKIKVVKRVSVSGTSTAAAYRLYTINVRGATASTTAVVRLEGGDDGGVVTLESVIR